MVCLLLRKITSSAGESLEIADGFIELLNTDVVGASLHARLAKRVHGSISSSDASVEPVSPRPSSKEHDDGRLHATVLTFTGFSDAEVKRVIPAELVHFV